MHPLQHSWCLWHDRYFQNQKNIHSFSTIEGFWRLYNNIPDCATIPHKHNLRWFKQGVSTMSEHSDNIHGCQWVISIEKRDNLSQISLHLILGMIGQTMCIADEVNGITVNVRNRCDRVCVWMKSKDPKVQAEVRAYIADVTAKMDVHVEIKAHREATNNYRELEAAKQLNKCRK